MKACNPNPEILRWRKFVDTQQIMSHGQVPTKQFLDANGISYVPVFDMLGERSMYLVRTRTGEVKIPTVITKDEAQQLILECSLCRTNLVADFNGVHDQISINDLLKWILAGSATIILGYYAITKSK